MKLDELLLDWYDVQRRDLPWRGTRDPYRIWLSEIMLQQTRTETVARYYARFLERFPTVADLAHADEDEVLKLWEGPRLLFPRPKPARRGEARRSRLRRTLPQRFGVAARAARRRPLRRERHRFDRVRRVRARAGRQPGARALPRPRVGAAAEDARSTWRRRRAR